MAMPFAKHPTIDKFASYAKNHGCQEKTKVVFIIGKGKCAVRYLVGPNKQSADFPDLDPDETHLPPSAVHSLCEELEIPNYYGM